MPHNASITELESAIAFFDRLIAEADRTGRPVEFDTGIMLTRKSLETMKGQMLGRQGELRANHKLASKCAAAAKKRDEAAFGHRGKSQGRL